MTDNNNFEHIEKYLEGKLDPKERTLFEERLKTDPGFAAKVEDYKLAVKSVESYGEQKLKARLKEIHKEEIKPARKFGRPELLKLAAIFVGLIIVSAPLIYNYLLKGPDYQALYEENFNPFPDILSQRGADNNSQILSEALSYYKNADYQNAAALFNALQKQQIRNRELIRLYAGISYLGNKEFEIAEMIFDEMITEHDNPFAGQARWYLSLSLLGSDKVEDAKLILEQIVHEKSYNHFKAQKLLDKL